MKNFETLREVTDFYYKNFYNFLRFEDSTIEVDGVEYKLEYAEGSPIPVLKLSFIDGEEEYVQFCIVHNGLIILSEESEDEEPDYVTYKQLVSELLFDFTLTDLGKLNFIFEEYKKIKGS